ncbi:MAG: DUF488 domain-containing protein [Promethearchaeota archaeon]
MFLRQRMLLGVIDLIEQLDRSNKLTLIKVLFLLAKEHPPRFTMYGFHPYKYGPFSTKIYSDLSYFGRKGYVAERENIVHILKDGKVEERLEPDHVRFVKHILSKYPDDRTLIDYIYEKYPEYTVRSPRRNIPRAIALDVKPGFFLIGYEGRSIDDFLRDLILNNIHVLVDVRWNARSMKYEFNKGRLEKAVKNLDIQYKHIPELGIAPEKRKNLKSKNDYEILFAEYARELPNKREYIEKIMKLGEKRRIALMCFEADVQSCHRRELGKILVEKGYPVSSI